LAPLAGGAGGGRGAGGGGRRTAAGHGTCTACPEGRMTLEEAQRAVDAWIGRFRDGYWPPLANLARLVEEVGELARELNHRYGPKTRKPQEPPVELALELGDILFVLLALANEQGIDMEDAFARVLDKYEQRDAGRWPPREPGDR
jgi:NTP pyrophosphatase (non-canonical NTP hydrolase)